MTRRLESLLGLRRRTEDAAARSLAAALTERARAEVRQATLEKALEAARDRLEAKGPRESPTTAAAGAGSERFRARLRAAVSSAAAAARAHQDGALREAIACERKARRSHELARREREVLEKLLARRTEEMRTLANRRAEDEASDRAIASHGRRPR